MTFFRRRPAPAGLKTIADIRPPRVVFRNIDWSKVRPATGAHTRDKVLAARFGGQA